MRRLAVFAVTSVLTFSTSVAAQNTDIEGLAGIAFNFGNPGARSMGMGGAFLGLADDASAAEANPAGLTRLRKPEVSVEGRGFRHLQELAVSGVFPDLEFERFSSSGRNVEVQFASVVIPTKHAAFAAYYHQPLNYVSNVFAFEEVDQFGRTIRSTPQFYFPLGNPPGSSGPIPEAECRALPDCYVLSLLPFRSIVQMKLETFGLAAAWKIGTLSVGGSVRYQKFEESAITVNFFENEPVFIKVQGTIDDSTFEPGTESDVTFAGGFKWDLTGDFSVGGVYKKGPEFPAPVFVGDLFSEDPFITVAETTFHMPDVAGIGLSFRPTSVLILNLDAVHVTYSNLTDDFQPVFLESLPGDVFRTEDGTELHLGGEYFFSTRIPFALRAGWWRDPAHGLEYVGPLTCVDPEVPVEERPQCVANRISSATLYPGGQDQDHFSIGAGLSWPNLQIDAAYETSEDLKVGSISAVYRF